MSCEESIAKLAATLPTVSAKIANAPRPKVGEKTIEHLQLIDMRLDPFVAYCGELNAAILRRGVFTERVELMRSSLLHYFQVDTPLRLKKEEKLG